MSKIPDEFQEFATAKKLQLFSNILTSCGVGVLVANTLALASGDASIGLLVETVESQVVFAAVAGCRCLGLSFGSL